MITIYPRHEQILVRFYSGKSLIIDGVTETVSRYDSVTQKIIDGNTVQGAILPIGEHSE